MLHLQPRQKHWGLKDPSRWGGRGSLEAPWCSGWGWSPFRTEMLITLASRQVAYPWLQELLKTQRSSPIQGCVPLWCSTWPVSCWWEASNLLQFGASLKSCSCFWTCWQISCSLCCTCSRLNTPFTKFFPSLSLQVFFPPHISIWVPVSWGTWSLLALMFLVEVFQRTWGLVGPWGGHGQWEGPFPFPCPWNTLYFATYNVLPCIICTHVFCPDFQGKNLSF